MNEMQKKFVLNMIISFHFDTTVKFNHNYYYTISENTTSIKNDLTYARKTT